MPLLLPNLVTTLNLSVIRIVPAALTVSVPRVVSTLRKTIQVMVTVFIACSMTRSRVVISAPVRLMSGAWRRFRITLSTSVWHRVSLLLATTPATWITVLSAAPRSLEPSMRVAKPVSSCCSVPTRRCHGRLRLRRLRCIRVPKCLTWLLSMALPKALPFGT